jgi:hypothetical protein
MQAGLSSKPITMLGPKAESMGSKNKKMSNPFAYFPHFFKESLSPFFYTVLRLHGTADFRASVCACAAGLCVRQVCDARTAGHRRPGLLRLDPLGFLSQFQPAFAQGLQHEEYIRRTCRSSPFGHQHSTSLRCTAFVRAQGGAGRRFAICSEPPRQELTARSPTALLCCREINGPPLRAKGNGNWRVSHRVR